MRKAVEFCDLCYLSGMFHLATASYFPPNMKRTYVCASCKELVEETGFDVVLLSLPEEFIQDIKDGLNS